MNSKQLKSANLNKSNAQKILASQSNGNALTFL